LAHKGIPSRFQSKECYVLESAMPDYFTAFSDGNGQSWPAHSATLTKILPILRNMSSVLHLMLKTCDYHSGSFIVVKVLVNFRWNCRKKTGFKFWRLQSIEKDVADEDSHQQDKDIH